MEVIRDKVQPPGTLDFAGADWEGELRPIIRGPLVRVNCARGIEKVSNAAGRHDKQCGGLYISSGRVGSVRHWER